MSKAVVQPQEGGDSLGDAVIAALSRPLRVGPAWGVLKTLLAGVLTLGILPLVHLLRSVHEHAEAERFRLWHLAEWLRVQAPPDQHLRAIWSMTQRRPVPQTIALWAGWALLLLAAGAVIVHFRHYGLSRHTFLDLALQWHGSPTGIAFAGALSGAYLLGVCWPVMDQAELLRKYVRHVNGWVLGDGHPPLFEPRIPTGLNVVTVSFGVVLAIIGALWALPMLLGASAQRQHARQEGPRVHLALARRAQDHLQRMTPHRVLQGPARLHDRCSNTRCRNLLPVMAAFCPRCGSRVEANERAMMEVQ